MRCDCSSVTPGPGNVRELEHTIERPVALERTNSIEPERLPEKITNYNPYRVAEAMEFPEEGINLTAHLDQLEKLTFSRPCGTLRQPDQAADCCVLRALAAQPLDKHGARGLTAQMRDERVVPTQLPPRATDRARGREKTR
jgi:two-component system response regulator PilR (NtrC family)